MSHSTPAAERSVKTMHLRDSLPCVMPHIRMSHGTQRMSHVTPVPGRSAKRSISAILCGARANEFELFSDDLFKALLFRRIDTNAVSVCNKLCHTNDTRRVTHVATYKTHA